MTGLVTSARLRRHRGEVERCCRRILPAPAAAGAARATFVRARATLDAGAPPDRLGPWLRRLAREVSLAAAGEAGYDYDELERAVAYGPAGDEDLERRAVIRETLASVAALPPRRRDALLRTTSRSPGQSAAVARSRFPASSGESGGA